MKILVCGGAGFIGSTFIRRVLAADPGNEVVNLDKLTYAGNLDNLREVEGDRRYRFVHADICDKTAVTLAAKGVDAIVNFAAETHVDRSIADPEAFIRTDVLGTHTLLEVMRERDIARMVQVSTDEVYGSIEKGSSTEADLINPSSPYSASKAGGDLRSLPTTGHTTSPSWSQEAPIPTGPTSIQKSHPSLDECPRGREAALYGDGLNVRDWLHGRPCRRDRLRAGQWALRRGNTTLAEAMNARTSRSPASS